MKIFAYDGPFNQFILRVVDCFFISMLWIIASIPIVTAGASTVALYYTVNQVIRKEEGKIWKCFWKAFFRDFWQATGIWLIMAVFYAASLASYSGMIGMGLGGFPRGLLLTSVLMVTLWTQFWYPYLSRFEDTTRTLLKNTLVMLLLDFFRSIKMLILLLVFLLAAYISFFRFPALLILLPSFYVYFGNGTVDKVFAKYIPAPEAEPVEETEEIDEDEN